MDIKIRFFVPLAVTLTCTFGLIYLIGQQVLRQSANDPQIQLAEDTNYNLPAYILTPGLIRGPIVDIEKRLTPFYIFYKPSGEVLVSEALLDGEHPQLPDGVLDYVRKHGQDRFTWQPRINVRIAAVITQVRNPNFTGFVLVGRSLREVERRENNLLKHVVLAYVVSMFFVFAACLMFIPKSKKK